MSGPRITVRRLQVAIATQRDQVEALERRVDRARARVDRAVDALRVAVRERDRGAVHLEHLRAWLVDVERGDYGV